MNLRSGKKTSNIQSATTAETMEINHHQQVQQRQNNQTDTSDGDDIQKNLARGVPMFQGKTDAALTNEFIGKVNRWFKRMDKPEDEKLDLACSKFTGTAYKWLTRYEFENEIGSPGELKTWEQLKTLIKKRFIPASNGSATLVQLTELRQGTKSVSTLADELLDLLTNIPNLSERERKTYFYNALKPEIQRGLPDFFENNTPFDDLLSRAVMIESAVNRERKGITKNAQQTTNYPPASASQAVAKKGKKIEKGNSNQNKNENRTITCQLCGDAHFNNQCPIVKQFMKDKISKNENASASVSIPNSDEPAFHRASEIVALLDTGCTQHMLPHLHLLTNTKECNVPVTIANGKKITATHVGELEGFIGEFPVKLTNVLYVPQLNRMLLALRSLSHDGYEAELNDKGHYKITKGKYTLEGKMETKLYQFRITIKESENAMVSVTDLYDLWHERLGHPGKEKFRATALAHKELAQIKIPEGHICHGCLAGKQTRASFGTTTSRATRPLELVHIDLVGPLRGDALGHNKYFLTILDDYSSNVFVVPIRSKLAREVADAFLKIINKVELKLNTKLVTVRSDNGTEFANIKIEMDIRGITHQHSIPYTPEQNGRVERTQRTLLDRLRALLFSSHLPTSTWPELIRTAAHIQNRLPLATLENRSPHAVFYRKNEEPKISYFRAIGSLAYVHINDHARHKLMPKTKVAYLLGYTPGAKGYRLFDPENDNILDAVDARFDETRRLPAPQTMPSLELEGGMEAELPSVLTEEEPPLYDSELDEYYVEAILDERKRGRGSQYLVKWRDEKLGTSWEPGSELQHTEALADWNQKSQNGMSAIVEPATLKEALTGNQSEDWKKAYESEIQSLETNQTWTVVPRAQANRTIDTKIVLKIKTDADGNIARYKVRLVARGFSQRPGDFEETYAPVLSKDTLRIMLAISNKLKNKLHQVDIKTAFLYAPIDKDIYLEQPEGYAKPSTPASTHVLKLNKSIYGLRQSPALWNSVIDKHLTDQGFIRCGYDKCLYSNKIKTIFIGIYVDDILISTPTDEEATQVKISLKKSFDTTDLGHAKYLLGMEISNEDFGITLSQEKFILQLLDKYGYTDIKPKKTPAIQNLKLIEHTGECSPAEKQLYQSMVGSLLYVATCTRPDIAAAVSIAGRSASNPSSENFIYVKGIFAYLKATANYALTFKNEKENNIIEAYSDADWAGDINDRKSMTGFTIQVFGTSISWRASKQKSTAKSSVESEIISLSDAANEVEWIRQLTAFLYPQVLARPTTIHCDSSGAVSIAINGSTSGKTKHIGVRSQNIFDLIKNKEIKIEKISTEDNTADILTKALGRVKFEQFRQQLGVKAASEPLEGSVLKQTSRGKFEDNQNSRPLID